MNRYYVTFLFKGEYQFVNFDANQLANAVLPKGDDLSDFMYRDKKQYFTGTIWHNSTEYEVVFSLRGANCLSVYNTEENGGYLVEGDIPWLVLKIENGDGDVVYDITKYI